MTTYRKPKPTNCYNKWKWLKTKRKYTYQCVKIIINYLFMGFLFGSFNNVIFHVIVEASLKSSGWRVFPTPFPTWKAQISFQEASPGMFHNTQLCLQAIFCPIPKYLMLKITTRYQYISCSKFWTLTSPLLQSKIIL